VDVIGKGKEAGVYLQENKTKSSIDQAKIYRQLKFDLQTLIYIVALRAKYDEMGWAKLGPILGVRYNVIRRSAHRSLESFSKKLSEDMAANRSGEWFARYRVEISPADVAKFRQTCLDPILEQLCDWWEMVTTRNDPFSPSNNKNHKFHWRHPNGVWNPMDNGAESEVDEYLMTGSEVGLQRTNNLFPELS
jgi:hypothetical protein